MTRWPWWWSPVCLAIQLATLVWQLWLAKKTVDRQKDITKMISDWAKGHTHDHRN